MLVKALNKIKVLKEKTEIFILRNLIDRPFNSDYSIRVHNKRIGFHCNDYHFDSNEICFIHIPKTAGTSINATIKMLNDAGAQLGDNYKKHIPISKYCPAHSFKYITCIRNPIDRVWSYYQMALRDKNQPYNCYTSKGIKYFLEKCWECRNLMTKYLTGDLTEIRKSDQDLIFLALNNLSNFYFVFDFEDLSSSYTDFINKVNRDYFKENKIDLISGSLPNMNSAEYEYPSSSEIGIICDYNHADIKLFETWKIQQ